MRTASLTVLALVAAFLFSVLPAQAAMDHGSGAAHYSDRAFLSGMIAHHEGAVDMAKVFLATPKKDQDPQVTGEKPVGKHTHENVRDLLYDRL